MMRTIWIGLTMLCFVGCAELDEGLNTDRKPTTAPGIASSGDIADVQDAAGGGAPIENQPITGSAPGAAPAGAADPFAGSPPGQPPKQSIIGKRTAKVVDANEAKKQPHVVEVENKVTGSDPLSVAASAYVAASGRASALNFKSQLKIVRATNGRFPTFQEYTQLAKKLRIEFALLPPYQMYGYDAKTGGLVVLEDKKKKVQLYKEAGIEISPEDKKFE